MALSDQHGFLPEIPPCDLLLIAGDVCPDQVGSFWGVQHPDRQKAWFDRTFRSWLARAPARHKILTWGNHDFCGQACSFRSDSLLEASTTELQILVDEKTVVPAEGGEVTVWATPWSNRIMHWAFMKTPRELAAVYAAIPEGVDILMSHQPPHGYGDCYLESGSPTGEHLGSRELLKAIERVQPRIVVCGHIHEGHGRAEHQGIPIYNVSVVDEQYRLVHAPTVIDLDSSPAPSRHPRA